MNCIFCKIINGEIPSYKVWENEKFFAFLDINPINKGHILLIPKNHVVEFFELKDDLYNEIFQIAKKLAKPFKEITNAKRVGLVIEGLAVPHFHLHIIPVYKGNDLNPQRAYKASTEELEEMQEILKNTFEKI